MLFAGQRGVRCWPLRPHLIFNMDEIAFELSSSQRMRRVAPRTSPKNGQAAPPSNEHITSVVCIGIDSGPVPPLVIYQGAHLQQSWFKVRAGGWQGASARYQHWLKLDQQLCDIEMAWRCLWFLYSRYCQWRSWLMSTHPERYRTKIDFLVACWARNIVVILLPAKVSGRF